MNVTIQTTKGPQQVPGYHSGVPGLLLTRTGVNRKAWGITHAPTGYAVTGREYRTRAEAREVAQRLAGLTDWTAGREEMDRLGRDELFRAAMADRLDGRRVSLAFDAIEGAGIDSIVDDLLPEDWSTDGYGIDSNLICPHGHMIELDGVCPEGCVSPLRTAGLI